MGLLGDIDRANLKALVPGKGKRRSVAETLTLLLAERIEQLEVKQLAERRVAAIDRKIDELCRDHPFYEAKK